MTFFNFWLFQLQLCNLLSYFVLRNIFVLFNLISVIKAEQEAAISKQFI